MIRQLLLVTPLLFLMASLQAQNTTYWSAIDETDIDLPGKRVILPTKSVAFQLSSEDLLEVLASAPLENIASPVQAGSKDTSAPPTVLSVPMPDGQTRDFQIIRYELMEANIQAKYPSLRAYYGRGLADPSQRIRLDWTTAGFRAMITTAQGTAFVDPYAKGNTEYYLSYYKHDYPTPTDHYECGVESEEKKADFNINALAKSGDCQFRSYRIAIACAAEYSNFHGATSDAQSNLVMSEVMTSVNRLNDVYEVDFTIRLLLVNNTDEVFYYDPANDPYTNGTPSDMITEVGPDLSSNIGNGNFDIGHVYGTNSGGLAGLRVVCGSGKARGVTGSGNPTNDPFWIDYVAHEVGHQFGGNHTQNNSCNRSSASFEPGSASTIMGYAGICNPNVQSNSDAYFHAISLAEVSDFVVNGNGGNCATIISNPNNAPFVFAGSDHVIPISTPYVLTAVATDGDPDDVLTYCWEQYDNEVGETMPPEPTNQQGPMFRSLFPTTSNQRYFPNLPTVIANGTNAWERLSSVSRDLNFRVTVRDNSLNAASCTNEDDLLIQVTNAAGPFLVTAPTDEQINWYENETKTISWDVAGTDVAPVNCANVDILLSYDGGFTYPVTLATAVPNNGTAPIMVPPLESGPILTARIMVRCSDNVFYDISNNDFSILEVAPTFTIEVDPASQSVCQGEDFSFTINSNAIATYADSIELEISDLPAGALLTTSSDSLYAGDERMVIISQTDAVVSGTYELTITATDQNNIVRTANLTLIVEPAGAAVGLTQPLDGAADISIVPTFRWMGPAELTTYQFQLSSSASFSNLIVDFQLNNVAGPEVIFPLGEPLDANEEYYWRVRVIEPCIGPFPLEIRSFTTDNCVRGQLFPNIPISPDGANLVYTSTVNSNLNGLVRSVEIPQINISHSYSADLDIVLISPAGTRVDLVSDQCGSADNVSIGFSDNAFQAVEDAPCNPLGNGDLFRPDEPLSVLIGETTLGDWTLEITDDANQDGGVFQDWSLEICYDAAPLPVSWLSFQASALSNSIQLNWSTAEERDNTGFEVERMAAGAQDFVRIGFVAATDRPEIGDRYTFEDKYIRTGVTYFYRIRQVDTDGSSSLSPVRSARIKGGNAGSYTLYPNPVTERLQLLISNQADQIRGYELFDITGKLIRRQNSGFDVQQGIDCSQLTNGVYTIRLLTDGKDMNSKRFVVRR